MALVCVCVTWELVIKIVKIKKMNKSGEPNILMLTA